MKYEYQFKEYCPQDSDVSTWTFCDRKKYKWITNIHLEEGRRRPIGVYSDKHMGWKTAEEEYSEKEEG